MNTVSFSIYLSSLDSPLQNEERLIQAACLYTGKEPFFFKTKRHPGGKPYFPLAPEVHFSVTHSGEYWACAFGSQPLGLDLQKHRPCNKEPLSKRFFHPEEHAFLTAKGFNKQSFFDLWSAKESYLKYTGEGLSGGLSRVCLTPPPPGIVLHPIPFLPHYSFCLCATVSGAIKIHSL